MVDRRLLPQRIAMLSVHTCPLATLGGKKTGGMNVYVRDFSRILATRGIQVDVFTRSEDECQPTVKHDLGPNARVIHIAAGPQQPISVIEIAGYLQEFADGVKEFASQEGLSYDLIHSHYWLSGLVAEKLLRVWPDLPVIQMFHTLGHMKNRVAHDESERAPQARIDGETRVMKHVADKIIAATPAEYAQLHWLYQVDVRNVVTLPPGVDLARFSIRSKSEAKERLGIPADHKNILFAGRIEPLKGIDTLLLAMALIRRLQPGAVEKVCVTIVGGDPWQEDPDDEMARLQRLREQLGVTEIVAFIGAKDQDVLPDYFAAAEMVVMPSNYESFGMVALEAMSMGTPVIASEVGGLAFLVKDGVNGFHVPSRDPEALAERIFTLLNDEDCRMRLGRQAHASAKQFDWSNIIDRMLRVYESVLESRYNLAADSGKSLSASELESAGETIL